MYIMIYYDYNNNDLLFVGLELQTIKKIIK